MTQIAAATGAVDRAVLRCRSCGAPGGGAGSPHRGCADCHRNGKPSNFVLDVPDDAVRLGLDLALTRSERSIWRYAETFGADPDSAVSLGEGGTPLVELGRLARELGVARLLGKNEAANPTWSHKDRLCAATVAAARRHGARVVCAASTGNHGASLAAYAAQAGMTCLVATLESVPETLKTLMQSYGAAIVAVTDSDDRYRLLEAGIEGHGWWPASNLTVPAVGSDPRGVAAYKTVAYELWEALGEDQPDWLVVPVAYGDCLAGIADGFTDLLRAGLLGRAPRLVGAELYGALARGLAGEPLGPVVMRPSAAFSLSGKFATEQAVDALRAMDGLAHIVTEDQLLAAQRELAVTEGIYAEAASAVSVAAVRSLAADGTIAPGDGVAVLVTSSGLKDPRATARALPPVPVVEPTPDALERAFAGDHRLMSDLFGSLT